MNKDYSDILYRVLEVSLENLAFMFSESVDISEIAMSDTESVKVSMDFTGNLYDGSLMMIIPHNISSELAANILGIEDTGDDAMNLGEDSLKEVLNVICGRILTEISGNEPLFDLSVPVLKPINSGELEQFISSENLCCAMIDDMYPIIMKFEQK
jgi:chemotaxis protein CheY-P-specific phosphatase CheC